MHGCGMHVTVEKVANCVEGAEEEFTQILIRDRIKPKLLKQVADSSFYLLTSHSIQILHSLRRLIVSRRMSSCHPKTWTQSLSNKLCIVSHDSISLQFTK